MPVNPIEITPGTPLRVVIRIGGMLATGGSGVASVNGRTGAVTLTKADVTLSNVDNTSDLNKPISSATQTALNGKANSVHTHVKADITDFPVLASVATTGSYADLTSKPATFPPSAHTHIATDISNFSEAVDSRVSALLIAGPNVSLVYDNGANTLTISATAGAAGVSSFNTRTGAVTLQSSDVSTALGYLPVASFNSRTGSVVLTSTDVTNALTFTPAASNHTHTNATAVAAGFMSSADKNKLDGLSNYTLPTASATVLGGVILDGTTTYINAFGKLQSVAVWDDIVNKPVLALVAETGVFSDLSGKPTTLAGYGITDAATLGANTFTGTQSLGGNIVSQARLQSYRETVVDLGTLSTSGSFSGGTLTLDYSLGNVFKFTRDAAISAITLTNLPASGVLASVTLRMKANGTTYAVTYPNGTIKRNGANPTLTNTNGQENHITLTTDDAGTTFTLYDGGIYY